MSQIVVSDLIAKLEAEVAAAGAQQWPGSETYHVTIKSGRSLRGEVVELWVHGGRARNAAQWLSFFNGDAHDRSKCQLRAVGNGRFYSVEA